MVASANGTAYACNGSSGGSGVQVQPAIADASTFAAVNEWAGLNGQTWTLCYKATRDNVNPGFIAYDSFGAYQFHAQCDNRGATFFVAKTGDGKLFGGYTARAWSAGSSDCDFHDDSHAFLFSLTNAFKHEQTDLYPGMSVHDCYNEGPTFGAGFDFYTNLSTDASVSLGNSFACPGEDFDQCSRDFAGRLKPMMIELEVYSAQ
jgi:hypothetical protein